MTVTHSPQLQVDRCQPGAGSVVPLPMNSLRFSSGLRADLLSLPSCPTHGSIQALCNMGGFPVGRWENGRTLQVAPLKEADPQSGLIHVAIKSTSADTLPAWLFTVHDACHRGCCLSHTVRTGSSRALVLTLFRLGAPLFRCNVHLGKCQLLVFPPFQTTQKY